MRAGRLGGDPGRDPVLSGLFPRSPRGAVPGSREEEAGSWGRQQACGAGPHGLKRVWRLAREPCPNIRWWP